MKSSTLLVLLVCASSLVRAETPAALRPVEWICTQKGAEPWEDKTAALGTPGTGTAVCVEIDASRLRQTVDGFGGSFNELGWAAMSGLDDEERGAVFEALFGESGCRFNLCRMPMGSSDFSFGYYSLNDEAGDLAMEHFSIDRDRVFLLPYIKAAMEVRPDLRVWGSPWSPPSWMKESQHYKALGKGMKWESEILKAYALYFEKAVRAYRDAGLNFEAIHVQNEPWANQSFPSCLWTGEQLRDFIRDYLGPHFREHGVDAEIWLGTINAGGFDWTVKPTFEDEKAMAYVTGAGFQWGGREIVAQCRDKQPELSLMQTETECGNGRNDWKYAEHTADLFRQYFTSGVHSYLQWNMILEQTQRSYWGWPQNSMVTILTFDITDHDSGQNKRADRAVFNPQFYMVKHITHFVDRGARLVELDPDVPGLAFINPDGRMVFFYSNRSEQDVALTISHNGNNVAVAVPARSFSTFVFE